VRAGANRAYNPRGFIDDRLQAVFGRKIKKDYESDATRMIRELLAERPQILAEQKTGRSLWWDRKLDLDQQRRTQESQIKQKGYVYQTDL
jgi:hypothetical protein